MTPFLRMTGRLLGRGLAGLVGILVGIGLFTAVQAPIVDSIGGAPGLAAMMQRLPPILLALSRTRPEFLAATGLTGFLAIAYTHPLILLLAGAAVVAFAARSLAGEMEQGTIQLTLSRPRSREVAYAARVLGLVVVVALVAVAGPVGTVVGLLAARPAGEFAWAHLLPLAVSTAALVWAIGGLALFGSAVASTAGRVVGWALGLLTVSYFVDTFADVWRVLQPWRPFSLFAYYDPGPVLANGTVNPRHLLVLAVTGLVGVVAGLLVFRRRDLPS